MSLLSTGEMAEVQALARSGMTGVATILTHEAIETENGQESAWVTGDDVPCWVRELTGAATTLGAISGAVGIGETFSIRLPVGSAVNGGDRLAVGSTIYDVQHVNTDDTYPVWADCACRVVD